MKIPFFVPLLICSLAIAGSGAGAMAQSPQEATANPQTQSTSQVDDTWISTKIKTELLAAKDVPGLDIKVETTNGVVELSGPVKSQMQADRVEAIAKTVKGVKRVDASALAVTADR